MYPLTGLSHKDDSAQSHASLSGCAESSIDQSIQGVFLVSIRHNDAMVLGPHIALHALSVDSTLPINELSSAVASNEGDGSDIWVVANLFGRIKPSLHDIQNSFGETYFLAEFEEEVGGSWHSLGRLEHVGVAACDSEGEHPERNHSREVERRHTCAHS